MDIKEIKRLIKILEDSRISELSVTIGDSKVTVRKPLPTTTAPPAPAAPAKAAEPEPETAIYITAPMVGIFHGIDAVTSAGTAVEAGQVVGTIESMKLMNDVVSEYDGVITEVLIEDGMAVEYGQNLFKLERK